MNKIDEIISESIQSYLLQEVWYKPSTWFNNQSSYQEPSQEELARRNEAIRQMSLRRERVDEYYNKLQEILRDICKGKETRLLDVGDKQGNQAYTLFETFTLGLINLTDNYISYGQVGSGIDYWKNKIQVIENMLNFIHDDSRLADLANKIEDDIRWLIMYYNNISKILV